MQTMMAEREMTLTEAAALFGVPRRTLNQAAISGRLKARPFGDQWAVTRTAVERWIKDAEHRPGPKPGYGPNNKAPGELPPPPPKPAGRSRSRAAKP